MATNTASSQFLDLPTDILLEILGRLPAPSIILRCRLVCRRMDQLSRNSHLWVQYLNQAKDVLCPELDLEQIGTTKFERMLCQTETLRKIWSGDSALQVAPRSWRSAPYTPNRSRGAPIGMMGEYMILEHRHGKEQRYTWVFIQDQNGPAIFSTATAMESELDTFIGCYMDPGTQTFYVAFIDATLLVVLGFQADASGPRKALEYRSRLRSDLDIYWLRVEDGYAYVEYYGSGSKNEVDVINLRKRDVSRFSLPTFVSLFPGTQNTDESSTKFTATDTHLICVVDQSGGTGCVVFRRPTTGLDRQPLDSNQGLLLGENVYLGSIVICGVPGAYTATSHVVPCSSTSFAIVQIWQEAPSFDLMHDQPRTITVRVISLTTLDGKVSIENISSTTIPGRLKSSALPVPPASARYLLGVLGVGIEQTTVGNRAKHEYFALKIDLPCPEQNSTLENKCQITLTKMCFAPVVDTLREETEVSYFDHFSGKIALTVSRYKSPGANVVIDYLSTAML